jgi:hypothetical protein
MTEEGEPGNPKLDVAKDGASILAAVYAVGYLVVTFRLSPFSVTPITWLRLQYLAAGIWCLLPFVLFTSALAFGGILFFEPWMKSWRKGVIDVPTRTRNYRYIKGSVLSAFILVAGFAEISRVLDGILVPASSGWWKSSYDITLNLAWRTLVAAVVTLFVAAPTTVKDESIEKEVFRFCLNTLYFCAAIALWVNYIFYFALTVYPAIPSTLGGGRPQSVVFIIDSGEHTSPVIADSSRTRSIPYKLLLQTENSYVVESPTKGEKVVEFKVESVRGMIVLQE